MAPPRRRGLFVTLEGGEGAGKSTQARLLARRLEAAGRKAITTREPGGSPGAEAIRHALLSGAAREFGATAETLLFAAARIDHLDVTIRPALTAGIDVVCDRFIDSTRAYQAELGKVDRDLVAALERVTVGDTRPDLTFILDLDARLGLARAEARRGESAADRFEGEGLAFHEALRTAFRAIAAAEPERCVLIDASADANSVSERIWAEVARRLELKSPHPAAPRPAKAAPRLSAAARPPAPKRRRS